MTKAKTQRWLTIGGAFAVIGWMAYLTLLVLDSEKAAGDNCLYALNQYEQIHRQFRTELGLGYEPLKSPCAINRMQP